MSRGERVVAFGFLGHKFVATVGPGRAFTMAPGHFMRAIAVAPQMAATDVLAALRDAARRSKVTP